jgi:3-(3-hydroxy-phenyl)propionate hydroxylase/6-hydroxy-3-succinoylpyridine 3-monooxygenase
VTDPIDTDVVIAGAGPVGLVLALHLARADVRVVVLEKEADVNMSPRAMVYLHPLLADLDAVGLLEPMLERAWVDREGFNLHIPANGEVISIPNTALEGVDPHPFNLHLGQGDFSHIALRELLKQPSATVVMGAEVVGYDDDASGVTVHARRGDDELRLRGRYLVGADGGRSVVRTLMGATLEGTTWDERFVATNVRFDFRALGFKSSNMYVDDEIGCIIAQITPDGLWRCTYQEPIDLPEETVVDRIPAFFAKLLGPEADVELVGFSPYRMHQRLSTSLREGHVILAGDAAHLTNPTGGLGLTTGLYDVFLLQEVLIALLAGRAGEELLDAYAAERSRVFSEVSSPNASHFKRLVYDSHDPEVLSRQVQPFRDAAASLEGQRAFLAGLDMVRSAPLVHQA